MSTSMHASSSSRLLHVEKEAILPAIRALPAGAQPSLSSSAYSRAALINHHATDGIDFNLLLSLSLSLQPFPTPNIHVFFNLLSPKSFTHCAASFSHLVPFSLLFLPHLLTFHVPHSPVYKSHNWTGTVPDSRHPPSPVVVCLFHPQPLASPAQYLISVRICGEPLRINERDMRLISASTDEIGFCPCICMYVVSVCMYKCMHSSTKESMDLHRLDKRVYGF